MDMSLNEVSLSGLYYPNKFGRIFLEALESIVGADKLNEILTLTGLTKYIEQYPPNNMSRDFDIAYFSSILTISEQLRQDIPYQIGRTCLLLGLESIGLLTDEARFDTIQLKNQRINRLAFNILPVEGKLKIGLSLMQKICADLCNQIIEIREQNDAFSFVTYQCPACWGQSSRKSLEISNVCSSIQGIIEELLRWITGGFEFTILETECRMQGYNSCVFTIMKTPNNSVLAKQKAVGD